jgi:hypothetical protein
MPGGDGGVCRFRFSLVNLRQRVAKIGFPPPLDVTRRTQGTQNSGEQQSKSSFFFVIIYYQSQSRIHKIHNNHGCMTTNWFRRTCKQSKITLYYWPHTMIIMQFTGLLSVHFTSFSFAFLFFKNPLVLLAMKTPQINEPR